MSESLVTLGDADSLTGGGQAGLVPRSRTLSGFAREAGGGEGIAIRSLAPGTTLNVRTSNSNYRLIVLDGGDEVTVRGGAHIPAAVPAHLQGASAGGSCVRTGWIEVGLRMELCVGRRRIITSPVRSIAIEGVPVRPDHFQRPS